MLVGDVVGTGSGVRGIGERDDDHVIADGDGGCAGAGRDRGADLAAGIRAFVEGDGGSAAGAAGRGGVGGVG